MEATRYSHPTLPQPPRAAQPLRYIQRGTEYRLEPATLIQPGDADCGSITDAQFGCAVALK